MTTKPDPDALADELERLFAVYDETAGTMPNHTTACIRIGVHAKGHADEILTALRAHSPEASRVGEAICQQCDPPGCGKECRGGDCATCGGTGRVRPEPVSPAHDPHLDRMAARMGAKWVSPAREEVERASSRELQLAALVRELACVLIENGGDVVPALKEASERALSALQPQQQERERIIAWLRQEAAHPLLHATEKAILTVFADRIERREFTLDGAPLPSESPQP